MRDVRREALTPERVALTPRRLALTVAAVVIVLDQITKVIAVASLSDGSVSIIGEFLELSLVRNPDAAFNLLRGAGALIGLLAIAAAVLIFIVIHRTERTLDAVVLGLILGGALGNLIDRVVRDGVNLSGRVIDFVDFSFWPTFNVADAAISVGAVLAIWEALRGASATKSPTS